MVSFWPFPSGGGNRIQDVKAPQMAQAAMSAVQKSGRTAAAYRLVFRTLELDVFNPEALLILCEIFRGKPNGARPKGDEMFAGLLLEYVTDRKNAMTPEQKRAFDGARMEIMKQWGFVNARGTETDVDHLGYMSFINELLPKVKSVSNAFIMARTKLGIQAGALDPAKGTPTRAYQEWLHADASTLNQ